MHSRTNWNRDNTMSFLSLAVRDHRLASLYRVMDAARLDALALSGVEWFEFATNHNVTVAGWERPYVVLVTRDGKSCALLHDLSSVRADTAIARQRMWVDTVRYYAEVPHLTQRRPLLPHWPQTVADMLAELGLAQGRVGFDAMPAPLREAGGLLPDLKLVPAARTLRGARLVKHADEVAVLREAASLSDWAIERFRHEIRPGRNLQELDHIIAGQTCVEAGRRFPGEDFQILRFMSLSGRASAAAHGDGFQAGAVVEANTVTVTICNVRLNGMSMENQRTFAVGRVDETTRGLMRLALAANEAGLAAARAGAPLSGVDAAAQGVIAAGGMGRHVLHRTGHGIGVGTHEYPEDMAFDGRPLLDQEVLVVEPGIYVPQVGGFRYVDGVVVGTRPETLTRAPKDMASMTID
jgi:Xaa-Pro aminopeptidase